MLKNILLGKKGPNQKQKDIGFFLENNGDQNELAQQGI
jgi:hypothetical protein